MEQPTNNHDRLSKQEGGLSIANEETIRNSDSSNSIMEFVLYYHGEE